MKKFGLIFLALLSVSIVSTACAGIGDTFASGTWRYKVTVVVDTPEGVKTGSAVREVHYQHGLHLTPEMMSKIEVKGEAVVVDLGQRGVLFAIMGTDDDLIVERSFPVPEGQGIEYYTHLKNARAVLPPNQYPQFVHFKDINDPKTVEGVQDVISCPNARKECVGRTGYVALDTMEKGFGAGVKLKEVTIEMTDEPVTYNVSNYLPPYATDPEFMDWFRKLPYGDSRRIGIYNFTTGVK